MRSRFLRLRSCLSTIGTLLALASQPVLAADERPTAKLETALTGGAPSLVELRFEVAGTLQLTAGEKPQTKSMRVDSTARYEERRLKQSENQSVRHYEQASADFVVGEAKHSTRLRDSRRLIVAAAEESGCRLLAVEGTLTGDESDLLDLPGNSLLVERLLPDHAVGVGDRWQHPHELLRDLLSLDAVADSQVESELVELTDEAAKMQLAGRIQGADEGVATEIELKAKYKFDRQARRVTWLALLVKEKHGPGHVSPGVEATAKLLMKIVPQTAARQLTDDLVRRLPPIPAEPQPLAFEGTQRGFRFEYEPNWHIMAEDPGQTVLRLVDRGELVAQCNVTPLPTETGNTKGTLAEFQEDVRKALGEKFGSFLRASEGSSEADATVFRVEVAGTVDSLPVVWRYFLIRDAAGHRLAVVFTCESDLVPRLGDSDQRLVSSVRLQEPEISTAAQPSANRPRE